MQLQALSGNEFKASCKFLHIFRVIPQRSVRECAFPQP